MSSGTHRYRDFLKACLCDRARASEMIASNPAILGEVSEHLGESALHHLAVENEVDAVRWLIEQGGDVDTQNACGQTPLMNAAGLGLTTMVELLLEAGASSNISDENGETPLHAAARAKENAALIIGMLVAAGADVNARCMLHETPLHVAHEYNDASAIAALVKNGADVNVVDLGGHRPGGTQHDEAD